jgi:phage gpG-like protein
MARDRSVDIDIKFDDNGTIEYLNGVQFRMNNLLPVWEFARRQLELANAANFTASGLPSGGWERRKDEYAWPIMRRTGRLFEDLTNLSGPSNVVSPKSASFGTDVEYAQFHQSGTRKMAQRLVVFEPTGFGKQISKFAGEYIVTERTQK